jgi:signal transduction histidine kinase
MPRRLRWLTIIVPALAVGAIELLSDNLLDVAFPLPLDTLLIVGAVLVLSAIISWFTFGRIDALTAELAAQNRALEARNSSARAFHRVSVAITALSELDGILEAVVGSARELLGADVAVLLIAGSDGRMGLRGGSGPPGAIRPGGLDADDEMLRFVDPAWAVGRLAAPLQRGGRTIGLLAIGSRTPRVFGVDDVEALATLANQAAIAIENAHLQARLRELAVVAERERIAREMHDGLAQVLGYVNTKSQAVDEYLATGRIDEARVQLAELASAARSVYVDVREAILGLRSPIEPGAGLVGAVEEYARRFAEASKLAVVVEATPAARAAALSPEAEAQVFRIIQESLTNVRKHADAHRATLTLDVDGSALVIRIVDDGRGFVAAGWPPAETPGAVSLPVAWPHYGLEAMRERATSIGGTIAWSSTPDVGAVVRLTVPVDPAPAPTDGDSGLLNDEGASI